jgi:hypothetical protein
MSTLSDKALQIAISQLGKEENPRGSNWGKAGDPIPAYLATVGINFPASWCMAFIYWCYEQAAEQLGLVNPMSKTGGVLTGWGSRPRSQVKLPQAGDVFIMDLGHGLGHTGIIEKIDPDGTLHTIEGNTNDSGSREGYEVARKIRHNQKPIIGYLRF